MDEDPKQPVELLGAATETMRAIRHPDGRITMETWSQPVRVKQPAGAWAWVDTTLTEQNGLLSPKVAKAASKFSAGGSSHPLVTFSPNTNQSVSLSWPTPLPRPTIVGNKATYANAAGPGADLVLTALPMGYRQEIVLRAKPAKPMEINLPVKAKGLKFQTRKDGRVELADAAGHLVARPFSANLFMGSVDGRQALATKSKPGRANPTLKTVDDGQSLVVGVDNSLLHDSTITYPLTIASTVTMSNADADVADDGALADATRPFLTAGTIFGIPNRVYLSFDTKGLIGKKVVDAKLSMLNTDAPACGDPVGDGIQVRRVTSKWDPNNLTWTNKPSSADEGAQTVTKA